MDTNIDKLLIAADLLFDQKQYEEAKRIYLAAALLSLPPLQLWGGLHNAELYENLTFFQRLSALYPTSTRILGMEAVALIQVGQIHNAIALYDRILSLLDSDSTEYYYIRRARFMTMYRHVHLKNVTNESLLTEFKALIEQGIHISPQQKRNVNAFFIETIMNNFDQTQYSFLSAVIADSSVSEDYCALLSQKLRETETLSKLKEQY